MAAAATVEDLEWVREYSALSASACHSCHGCGLEFGLDVALCGCVARRIFGILAARYRGIEIQAWHINSCQRTRIERGRDARCCWARKNEEFRADLWLLGKRLLTVDDFRLFRLYSLEGRGWEECCRATALTKGQFFRAAYRVQVALGRAAAALEPYPLYPLGEYFN